MAVTLNSRDVGGFVRLGPLARVPMVGGRPRELVEDVFMRIEQPDELLRFPFVAPLDAAAGTYATIGDFYGAIGA